MKERATVVSFSDERGATTRLPRPRKVSPVTFNFRAVGKSPPPELGHRPADSHSPSGCAILSHDHPFSPCHPVASSFRRLNFFRVQTPFPRSSHLATIFRGNGTRTSTIASHNFSRISGEFEQFAKYPCCWKRRTDMNFSRSDRRLHAHSRSFSCHERINEIKTPTYYGILARIRFLSWSNTVWQPRCKEKNCQGGVHFFPLARNDR